MTGKLFIVGVGPGHHDHMTDRARWAIKQSDTIVGYETYVNLVKDLISGKDVYRYAMTQEVERAHQCIDLALSGKTVSLVSSGDPHGMAGIRFYQISYFTTIHVNLPVMNYHPLPFCFLHDVPLQDILRGSLLCDLSLVDELG